MKFVTSAGGREIVVEIDDRDRDFNQFCIAVVVDGKEQLAGWFTDHREDVTGLGEDAHDDEVEVKLLDRLERDGLLKDGMTAFDARGFLGG